jgi:predicted Zn-dependent protease
MRHWSALVLLALLIVSCVPAGGRPPRAEKGAYDLFAQGLDQVAADKNPTALRLLEKKFPSSPWTSRARTVILLRQKSRERARALRAVTRERDRCRAEKAHLAHETQKLKNALEKLKKLLIENEMRHH